MLNSLSPQRAALLVTIILTAIIAGAWIFQFAGYLPCDLCYYQRWAYYAGIPLGAFLAITNPRWIKWGLLLLGVLLVANSVLGAWHSGIEWGWWKGPATCTGSSVSDGLPDLGKPAVMCDKPAIRILGLSLAGWNAIVCAVMAFVALRAARKA